MPQCTLSRRLDAGEKIRVSFEFFPPKTEAMEQRLRETLERLGPLDPDFVSVTYGAGGSTRERSLRTVRHILDETGLDAAAHLTCVDADRGTVDAVIREYAAMGVKRFVAVRGDPTEGVGAAYRPHPDGYANAVDLTGALSRHGDFDISVSAYPEKHPESPDFATEIEMLKRKVDNGATRAITQFFFENDVFEAYVERVRRAGIYIPIVPGVMPIQNFQQMVRFAGSCGAHVPAWLADRFQGLEDDPETHKLVAAAVAAEQVLDLMERGVYDFHFYTMNRADLVFAICQMIGIRPVQESAREQSAAA